MEKTLNPQLNLLDECEESKEIAVIDLLQVDMKLAMEIINEYALNANKIMFASLLKPIEDDDFDKLQSNLKVIWDFYRSNLSGSMNEIWDQCIFVVIAKLRFKNSPESLQFIKDVLFPTILDIETRVSVLLEIGDYEKAASLAQTCENNNKILEVRKAIRKEIEKAEDDKEKVTFLLSILETLEEERTEAG